MTAATTHDELVGTSVAGCQLERCLAHDEHRAIFAGSRAGARVAIAIHFAAEADLPRAIVHPCVARTLGTERRDDGSLVVIREWIEGTTLEARLAGGPLGWPAIHAIVRDLARGLGAIHAAGLVHRALAPSNIVLPASGIPRAVIVDHEPSAAAYRAPESGPESGPDARADLYAVGVVLHQMLTGALPSEDPMLPIISPAADLCLWLLAKDPAERVPNAHVLRLTLETLERSSVPVPTIREITA